MAEMIGPPKSKCSLSSLSGPAALFRGKHDITSAISEPSKERQELVIIFFLIVLYS